LHRYTLSIGRHSNWLIEMRAMTRSSSTHVMTPYTLDARARAAKALKKVTLLATMQLRKRPPILERVIRRSTLSEPYIRRTKSAFLFWTTAFELLTTLALHVSNARAGEVVAESTAKISFRDVAASSGIRFEFESGSRGRHDLPEIMGGGVAVFDADGDGRLDVYFCNGGPIASARGAADPPCRFYRGLGGWRFEEITEQSGAPGPSYAMGAAVGDFDGDGRSDLFVTGWRDQRLYRNLGNGHFEDVTRKAGVTSSLWSTSAAFADLDGDGDLDLYVANYLEFDPDRAPFCAAPDGARDYCGPEDFQAQRDRLYRNNGDGTFTDVADSAGAIDRPEGRGLGVLIAELTGDNRPDIYVANDGTPCRLLANRGNLRFEDIGEACGAARDGNGQVLAGMGIANGDVNGDGRCDLIVTNFLGRSTIPFVSQKSDVLSFVDAAGRLGLAPLTRHVLGFGAAILDFDGDGRLELIEANGHVLDRARLGTPYAMNPLLLRLSASRFEDISRAAGDWFGRPILGRGLAVGDLDGDGRPDVVASALGVKAAVLRNESSGGNLLGLDLLDRHGRPAVGARALVTQGDHRLAAFVVSGGSYLAASQQRLWIGLLSAQAVDRIDVTWPWGATETWGRSVIASVSPVLLKEGSGRRSGGAAAGRSDQGE
jgi:enediyne biosynthesis protein E4